MHNRPLGLSDAPERARTLLQQLGERAADLAPADIPFLLGELARVDALLRLRLGSEGVGGARRSEERGDRMISASQAAVLTGMSKGWLYAHARAGKLPFARRMGASVRFSEQGIRSWLAEKDRRPSLEI
jgi:excisionase family DNA binding protein